MALAEKLHHTSRGQRFARAGEEGREEDDALRRQRPPPPQPELFQLYDEEPGGSPPACLVAPRGPQEAVQRHTVEQLADVVPVVQVLDAPGLLGEVGVVDFFRGLDAPAMDELVIAVPNFCLPRIPKRCPRRRLWRAEQLVEVPTIISYSSLLQRNVEQTIDTPVPHDRGGRGGGGGLQGFSQGQGSTAYYGADFVDIPVPPGRGGFSGEGLHSFSQGQGSTAYYGADFVDIPVPPGRGGFAGGGLHSFSQGQGSTAFFGAAHADFPVPPGRVGGGGLQGFLP